MKRHNPPGWADRFLAWYCNPELLEEIQGDMHELYAERMQHHGRRKADIKYIYDVVRFFRWSNIRRAEYEFRTGSQGTLWTFNLKMAMRTARSNKLNFGVKILGLSACLTFSLLLTAFLVSEITYDHFHTNHDRLYRITSRVNFQDHVTHYAVTPLPIGGTVAEGIPEVTGYTRFMYEGKPTYRIGGAEFYDEATLSADSNFLRILTFRFIQGDSGALDLPNTLVLTKTAATKLFGAVDPMGQSVQYGKGPLLTVSGVLDDLPSNSHLKFNALVSWSTFERDDDWGNLNAYTYILLRPGADISEVHRKMPSLLRTFHELVARAYQATYEPIFERITDIHFSEPLDEDIAEKRNETNLGILMAVIVLFLITGLINFLNLTMAEITAKLKRIGIIRAIGGVAGSHYKILLADSFYTVLVLLPVTLVLFFGCWTVCQSFLSFSIDARALLHPLIIGLGGGFLILVVVSSLINALMLSKASNVVHALKGKLSLKLHGTPIRKILVGTQLAFSTIMISLMTIVVDQFRFIQESDKGFEDRNTIVIKLRSGDQQSIEGFNEAVRKLSGVSAVSGSSYYPGVLETKYVFQLESEQGMEERLVPMMLCGYDYFDALAIKLGRGRFFDRQRESDRFGAFIINETAAKEFGWKDGLGKKINGPVGGDGDTFKEGEVIGVVRDFNFASLHTPIEPLIIFLNGNNWYQSPFIYIKTDPFRSPELISKIEELYSTFWQDPFDWQYLDAQYLSLYRKDYEMKNIFQAGLVISIVICCLGIFSLSALLVSLRTKELGIRKVVGANFRQLFFLHIQSFLQFLGVAILAAWPCIHYLSSGWLTNFAYHIDLTATHFLTPALLASVIVLATSGYHAIQAALLNPVESLKYE